jgi:hypothetical protein
MRAAARGIELASLEVRAGSRSDLRGLLGMAGTDDKPVSAGPCDMQMHIRVSAHGVPAAELRILVEDGCHHSPMARAVEDATALAFHIEIDAD